MRTYALGVDVTFKGPVFEWRGPAPFHFVALPAREAAEVADLASSVTYGWGMIPVTARIGSTEFTTSLWPKEGTYYLPLKDAVRRAERIVVHLVHDGLVENVELVRYLNRLSSLLFVLGLYEAALSGVKSVTLAKGE